MPQDKTLTYGYYAPMTDNSCHKNLKLLWWLRSLTIIGEIIAIWIATNVIQIRLQNVPWLFDIIGGLFIANLFTVWRIKTAKHVSELEFFMQLMIDLTALFGMLYLTGGVTNPFSSLFILQVIIAAITLSPIYAWMTALVSIALYTALLFWNVEMIYLLHHFSSDYFSIHGEWRWGSFVALSTIVAWFAGRMAATIRKQDRLLGEAEKIVTLGTFASSAAHELGTPLATIAVVTGELEKTAPSSQASQYSILKSQIALCKSILSQVASSAGMLRGESGKASLLMNFIESILSRFTTLYPKLQLNRQLDSSLDNIQMVAEYSLEQALLNILKNAVDASAKTINVKAYCKRNILYIAFEDDGVGIAEPLFEQIGNPGVSDKTDGMGIGLYLAKTVLMRLDGSLTLSNRKEGGAIAAITLPLRGLGV